MIYERLVSLAYPVMYDLGPVSNARDWNCDGGHFIFVPLPNKYLFADQADGAQFIGRFTNWTTRIAVAQAHAVGSAGDARIPGSPRLDHRRAVQADRSRRARAQQARVLLAGQWVPLPSRVPRSPGPARLDQRRPGFAVRMAV